MTGELNKFWATLPTTVQHYQAGQTLAETDANHSPILRRITQGRIKITASVMGEKKLLGFAGAGHFLGLRSSIVSQNTQLLTWTTHAETSIEEISWGDLKPYLDKHAGALMLLQHEARKRLYQLLVAMHPQFSGIIASDRKTLMEHISIRSLSDGEQLIQEGGEKPPLYLIISGQLAIYQHRKLICYRESGDIIGEMSVFGFSQSPMADVISKSTTEIMVLPAQDILNITRGNLPIRQWLVNLCEQRFAEIVNTTVNAQHKPSLITLPKNFPKS